jgi:class 3 adenylate cyclase/tetratricopeptide (TPR) repeat protein
MPLCNDCGKANAEDASFCSGCGSALASERAAERESRKTVTFLFTDLAGSTSIAERLDSESFRRVLLRYFEEMRQAIERHGGRVAKYIGDAVMGVFGVPTCHEDDALRAIRAAADMRSALERLNDELEREWGVRLQTRTGVNTGEVVVGDPSRVELLFGDAVTVAARLEQTAKRGEILLGEETYALARGGITATPVEPLTLKGRSAPVPAFRLVEVALPSAEADRGLDSQIVGRARELSELRKVFELVVEEGRPRVVTVLGAPGVGKSRLASELTSSLQHRATVLRGRCLSYGEGITYWPLAELVKDVAGINDEDPSAEAQRKIGAILDSGRDREFAARTIAGALGLSEARSPPEEIFWAARKLFEALARDRPLVLVFDDLHWGEPTLLNLVEYLARSSDCPLLLLCMGRLDLRELRPTLATDEENRSLISLLPLRKAESEELIRNLLGEAPLPKDLTTLITDAAGGNPLFAGEMLRMLVDEGLLERDSRGWRVVGDLAEVHVPSTVEAVLAGRLDQLEAGERDTIERASVIGEEFWPEAVVHLSPPALRERVSGHLEKLVHKELVVTAGHPFAGEEAFKFSHILVRDVAYGALLKESRSELHERFADWLETKAGERVTEYEAILGYHLDQAYRCCEELGPVDDQARILARRAADRLASAGKRAASSREDATAVSLLSRASALLPRDASERLELLPIIGESLEGAANHARAGEIYAEALQDAIEAGHHAVEGRARLGRAHVEFISDPEVSLEEIVAKVKEAIAILEKVGEQQALAKAWRTIGEARVYQGRAADGQRALEHALDYVDSDVSPRTANAICFSMGMCLLEGPEPLGRALAFSERELKLARARGRPSLEADMLHLVGIAEARSGRLEAGRRTLTHSTAISEELGLRYMAQWSRRSLGHVELWAEEPEAAERALRWSYEVLDEMELMGSLGETVVPLADALLAQGRYDEAAGLLEKIRDDWTSGDASVAAPLLMARAKLAIVKRRYDQAERLACQGVELVEATDWACLRVDSLLTYGEVLSAIGRRGTAIATLWKALQVANAKRYVVGARKAARNLEELSQGSERFPRRSRSASTRSTESGLPTVPPV